MISSVVDEKGCVSVHLVYAAQLNQLIQIELAYETTHPFPVISHRKLVFATRHGKLVTLKQG